MWAAWLALLLCGCLDGSVVEVGVTRAADTAEALC